MTGTGVAQLLALIVLVGISTPLLGSYMAKVYGGGPAPCDRVFGPVERLVYRACRIDEHREQRWNVYALSLLAFSLMSILFLYLLLRVQQWLPMNPDGMVAVPSTVSFNTAISFVTNTNWQNYAGESTMSHLSQMMGLTVQNFVSAAVGMAGAVAFIRGLTRRRSTTIGNFWVDITRTVVRILLPISLVFAVVLISQGVVANLNASSQVHTVESQVQSIPGGAIASQEIIKHLGTNGGGPFNANAGHPFENPNGLTNLLLMWAMFAIPFALTYTFGKLAGDIRQGWVVFAAMFVLWLGPAVLAISAESGGNPALTAVGANQVVTVSQAGGNLEGKEVRFGPQGSAMFAAVTTGTSTGGVNSAHDSMTPLGGAVPLVEMMLGEVSPGGTGSGLYGMLIFALLAVFIAGLMVGRTPEYLGKKIQAVEMKLVVLYILFVPMAVLTFTGISLVASWALSSLANDGPHGLTEMTYAFTSASNNNGSAFGGLTGNTDWFNLTLGLCMLVGRFMLMIPMLAIAGSLARKQPVPASAGTFPTGTPLFAGLVTGVVVIVVGLTYFPLLALGPIVEHLNGGF